MNKTIKTFDLQKFAEAVSGTNVVYFYRVASKATEKSAVMFPLVTQNERSGSKSADSTATKDGSVRTPGPTEVEITSSSIKAKNDPVIKEMNAAFNAGELIECWETDLSTKTTDKKCDAIYYQGYFTDFGTSSEADGLVEVSTTFGANGAGVEGQVTLTAEQEEEIMYAFRDLAMVTTKG